MGGMGISDEAVEAAAYALKRRLAGVVDDDDQWEWKHDARAALEAAAPHMLADVWAEGHEDGFWNGRLSHGDPEALTGIEHAKATNPYRSQA